MKNIKLPTMDCKQVCAEVERDFAFRLWQGLDVKVAVHFIDKALELVRFTIQ